MTAPATHGALQRSGPSAPEPEPGWPGLASALGTVAFAARRRGVARPARLVHRPLLGAGGLGRRVDGGWRGCCAWPGTPAPALRASRLARRLEELGAWRRGTLTSLLDAAAPGTSGALLDLADRRSGRRAAARGARGGRAAGPPGADPPGRWRGLPARIGAAGIHLRRAAAGSGGRALASRHARGRLPSHRCGSGPRASWSIEGDSVEFQLEAMGRKTGTLWLRSPGEAWRPRGVRLDSLGRATRFHGPAHERSVRPAHQRQPRRPTRWRSSSAPGVPRLAHVIARIPAYLELESEPVPTGGDTLMLPAGTRLDTRGEVDRAAGKRGVEFGGTDAESLTVSGEPVRRELSRRPDRASTAWRSVTASGAPMAGDSVRLPVRIVPDSAPHGRHPGPRCGYAGAAQPQAAAGHRRRATITVSPR